jgi:hypothetical protein
MAEFHLGVKCMIGMLVQMNDGDGSRSSEQESEGRADSGQSAVSFASCTLHVLLHIDRVCATALQLIRVEHTILHGRNPLQV